MNMDMEYPPSQGSVAAEALLGDGIFDPQPLPPRPRIWSRARYRLGQFVRGLTATVDLGELRVVAQLLPKPSLARFSRMPLDGLDTSI